jgi:hypothetical protein
MRLHLRFNASIFERSKTRAKKTSFENVLYVVFPCRSAYWICFAILTFRNIPTDGAINGCSRTVRSFNCAHLSFSLSSRIVLFVRLDSIGTSGPWPKILMTDPVVPRTGVVKGLLHSEKVIFARPGEGLLPVALNMVPRMGTVFIAANLPRY